MIGYSIIAAWAVFAAVWIFSAHNTNPPKYASSASPWLYLLPLVICDALLIFPIPTLTLISFPVTGLVMVLMGLAFAIWARARLGSSWTGDLTIQENHQLIRSGPYAIVRHPIYAGLLLAFLGTGAFIGELRGFIAPFFALIAFTHKIKIEERQLRIVFPEYQDYQATTPALVPWIAKY